MPYGVAHAETCPLCNDGCEQFGWEDASDKTLTIHVKRFILHHFDKYSTVRVNVIFDDTNKSVDMYGVEESNFGNRQ